MPLTDFSERYPGLTSRLQQARLRNRIAHAYLFVGEMGSVQEEFATAFMQLCVCTQLTDEGDACGTCQNCMGIANNTYPYRSELRPRSKMRQIRIEQVRDFEHDLHLTTGGKTRLAVIYDADRMNENAQNAFLKTLEEPAANTIIILITSSPGSLLATIRSRCQTVALHDNQVSYDAYLDSALIASLARIRVGAGALSATQAAHLIRDMLKEIKSKFDADAEVAIREMKAMSKELEPDYVEKREAEIWAQYTGMYRGERGRYLSVLHAWFSQEFMRAEGVADDVLPHPEFLSTLATPTAPGDPKDARTALNRVEELIHTLQYNVDESLAIEDFCQSVCAKV